MNLSFNMNCLPSPNKIENPTFWAGKKKSGCPLFFYKCIPKRSKITFKLDKIFFEKKNKNIFSSSRTDLPKSEGVGKIEDPLNCLYIFKGNYKGICKQNQRIPDFAYPLRLWEDRSRRPKNIFRFFQKFFKSILSNLNTVFDRFGIDL